MKVNEGVLADFRRLADLGTELAQEADARGLQVFSVTVDEAGQLNLTCSLPLDPVEPGVTRLRG